MKLWKWQEGRQKGTLYKKFPLWFFKIWKWGFDAYILVYQPDTFLKLHKDLVEKGNHWRLNIGWGNSQFHIANSPKCGFKIGKFSVYLFRPDLYLHALSVYGKTIKLSFGFVKFYT